MIRSGQLAILLTMILAVNGPPGAWSDEGPRAEPKAAEAVDRILREWQAKAQQITSVEVRFRRTDQTKGWDKTTYDCLAILATPDLAMMESSRINADGKAVSIQERLIWNGRSILQFDMEERRVWRFPRPEGWTSPPGPLRLPFFFRMTVEGAKQDYDWTLLTEDEHVVVLRATSKQKSTRKPAYQHMQLVLDRQTFLPKLVLATRDGNDRQTFEPLEIKRNSVKERADLEDPCLDAWTLMDMKDDALTRWLMR